jgi:hypothetical protein
MANAAGIALYTIGKGELTLSICYTYTRKIYKKI